MSSAYCIHNRIAADCQACKRQLTYRCLLCFQQTYEPAGPRFMVKCRVNKDSPILSVAHKMTKEPTKWGTLGTAGKPTAQEARSSPVCVLCGHPPYAQKREKTQCVDGSERHSLRPYPFRCEECKGLVFVFDEKDIRRTLCERTWNKQHVIAERGFVGSEGRVTVPKPDATAQAEIKEYVDNAKRSWRTRRFVWRSKYA